MRVDILTPEREAAYEAYLLSRPESLLYQSTRYKHFLKQLLACEEEYLVALEGDQIHGVLPLLFATRDGRRVYNSLPYYGSNGGIVADDTETFNALLKAYNAIASRPDTLASTLVTSPLLPEALDGISHTLTDHRIGQFTPLPRAGDAWETLMATVDSSARRNVKKALAEGVTVEVDGNQFDRLREMHQANMAAIGGLAKTDRFFAAVPQCFRSGQDFRLYVAKQGDAVIAALLLFYYNQTVEYFTPATDAEHRTLQALPLIIMTAMSDAARQGFAWWNWGGTWVSQGGVYRFKKKWAAIDLPYDYYTQLNDPALLHWTPSRLSEAFPHFFILPFAALQPHPVGQEA